MKRFGLMSWNRHVVIVGCPLIITVWLGDADLDGVVPAEFVIVVVCDRDVEVNAFTGGNMSL